jgi:hypothetical protein
MAFIAYGVWGIWSDPQLIDICSCPINNEQNNGVIREDLPIFDQLK